MQPHLWPGAELDLVLERATVKTQRITLSSNGAADRLRYALYKRRATAKAPVKISKRGCIITVSPAVQRPSLDPILKIEELDH